MKQRRSWRSYREESKSVLTWMIVKFIVSCMIRKIERILNPKYIIRRTVLFYLIRLKSLGTIEYIEEKCERRKCLVNRSSSPFLFNSLTCRHFTIFHLVFYLNFPKSSFQNEIISSFFNFPTQIIFVTL